MFNPVVKTFQYGNQTVMLETGKVARQATGSVIVTMGNSQVLATVVGRKKANPGADFFPLTVNYQEKTYAVGKIPGGFFKREGRNAVTGAAWLSSARVVRCWVKSRNERNPCP